MRTGAVRIGSSCYGCAFPLSGLSNFLEYTVRVSTCSLTATKIEVIR